MRGDSLYIHLRYWLDDRIRENELGYSERGLGTEVNESSW